MQKCAIQVMHFLLLYFAWSSRNQYYKKNIKAQYKNLPNDVQKRDLKQIEDGTF